MQRTSPDSADQLAAMWARHRHWVAAVLHAHRPRQAGSPDLDDLLQEVAMVLVRKQHELQRIDAIEPWLRTVALNIARDAGRRVTAAGKVNPADIVAIAASERHQPDEHSETRASTALGIALDLPAVYREPLLLSLRGLSYRQIGRVLELPESTIQNRLFRARAMVREEMQARQSPPLRLAEASTE